MEMVEEHIKGILKNRKIHFTLIDPDEQTPQEALEIAEEAILGGTDGIMIGGSTVNNDEVDETCKILSENIEVPIILFPGNINSVSKYADALLYLSLISGRNPELLIGQHVISAPVVKQSGLEIMPTGYMVIDGGAPTTVSYISNASPLPSDKNEIAMCTAMAGEMLGMKLIYMDAGSGAKRAISESMIEKVAGCIDIPLIIGGGITNPEKAYLNCKAGADVIVVGNAIEKDASLIKEIAAAIKSVPVKVVV